MRYYIIATRTENNFPQSFSVGYDNRETDTYENFMFFDTWENAVKWIKSDDAKEWKDCSFDIVDDAE